MVSSNTCRCCLMGFAVLFSVGVLVYALTLAKTTSKTTIKPSTPANSNGTRAKDTLKFVIVVSRHGNRRLFTFPNDPYPPNNTNEWPYKMSQLTKQGRVGMYNLGVKLRSMYNGFLNQYYYSEDFYATSTVYERVVMSGEAFVAGLYPPKGFQIWDKSIMWQPIPVYTDSPDKLPVMDAGTCPRLVQAQNITIEANAILNGPNFTAVDDYLNPYTGLNGTGADGFFPVWDTLICEDTEGFGVPEWAKKVYPEPMTKLAGTMYIAGVAGEDVETRIIIGLLWQQMIGLMISKANGTLTPDRKMYFYSGHDTSIVTLQNVIGIPKSSMIGLVKPASAMVFELHEDPITMQFTVQVLYVDGGDLENSPILLDSPACSYPCDLYKLANITHRFYNITNFDEECWLNSTTGEENIDYRSPL